MMNAPRKKKGVCSSHQHAEHFKSKKSSSLPLLLSSAATDAKRAMITPTIFFIVDFSTLVITWRKAAEELWSVFYNYFQPIKINLMSSTLFSFSFFSFFLLLVCQAFEPSTIQKADQDSHSTFNITH
jgi:hypothetical protein